MDKYDIPFLFKSIDNEMPLLTNDSVKVKNNYDMGMPKDLERYCEKVDDKFLNNHLATIEEFDSKFPNNDLVQWFKDYQNRYFSANIPHDNFLKNNGMGRTLHYQAMGIKDIGFLGISRTPKVLGTVVETAATDDDGTGAGGTLYCNKLLSAVTLNAYFDQIAPKMYNGSNTAGNNRLGCYADNGSTQPGALLVDSGSVARGANNTYTFNTVTEFQATTTTLWLAVTSDATGTNVYGVLLSAGGVNKAYEKTFTYAALPNPFGSTTTQAHKYRMKISHS